MLIVTRIWIIIHTASRLFNRTSRFLPTKVFLGMFKSVGFLAWLTIIYLLSTMSIPMTRVPASGIPCISKGRNRFVSLISGTYLSLAAFVLVIFSTSIPSLLFLSENRKIFVDQVILTVRRITLRIWAFVFLFFLFLGFLGFLGFEFLLLYNLDR